MRMLKTTGQLKQGMNNENLSNKSREIISAKKLSFLQLGLIITRNIKLSQLTSFYSEIIKKLMNPRRERNESSICYLAMIMRRSLEVILTP